MGTWTFAPIPIDLAKATGVRARLRVKGTIDGASFAGTLLPFGNGRHFIVVRKELRDKIGKKAGDSVKVKMDIDSSKSVVDVPRDFARALAKNKRAAMHFDRIAPSHKKNYLYWINEAKKPETRERRISRAVRMLAAGKLAK